MEIRIGVLHTPKELELEVQGTADEVAKVFDDALKNEGSVVWLTDVRRGRRVGVPAARLAYVEIESDHDAKRVGFGPS